MNFDDFCIKHYSRIDVGTRIAVGVLFVVAVSLWWLHVKDITLIRFHCDLIQMGAYAASITVFIAFRLRMWLANRCGF